MPFSSIPEILEDLKAGKMIVLVDDEDRENEGDIVLAAEQGFLSLDDDIHKYIPELPDYGQPVTLREMLHHTSGFGIT